METESDSDAIYNWYTQNGQQMLGKRDWNNLNSEDEPRLSKLQYYLDRPEYREVFWKLEET